MNSNSTSLTINMIKPVFLKANWITQYYVTIISPTGSPTGSGWYNAGNIATVSVQSTVQYSNGTRQIFTGWNSTSLGKNPRAQITVNAPTTMKQRGRPSTWSPFNPNTGHLSVQAGTMLARMFQCISKLKWTTQIQRAEYLEDGQEITRLQNPT